MGLLTGMTFTALIVFQGGAEAQIPQTSETFLDAFEGEKTRQAGGRVVLESANCHREAELRKETGFGY